MQDLVSRTAKYIGETAILDGWSVPRYDENMIATLHQTIHLYFP